MPHLRPDRQRVASVEYGGVRSEDVKEYHAVEILWWDTFGGSLLGGDDSKLTSQHQQTALCDSKRALIG